MGISEQVLTTDTLVVGAGLAGCLAAIRARESGADVIMVEQRKSGFCGESAVGMHIYRFLHPEDDIDAAIEGTVVDSEYMVDQDYLAIALKDSWDRFQNMIRFGVKFRKDDSGEIEFRTYETDYPDFQYKYAAFEPMAKYHHMLGLTKESIRRGVKILDRVTIVDLIVSDGKVQGAVGFNIVDGTFYVLKAGAVVMASGNFGGPGLRSPSLTGDGLAMAMRAGAEVKSMEFGPFEVAAKGPPTFMQRGLRPEPDYYITNAKSEEFLEKYEETRRLPSRPYAGAPWRRQTRVLLREWMEGRGPTYFEIRKPKGTNFSSLIREYWGAGFDKQLKWFEDRGYAALGTLKYELVIWRPGSAGGVRINGNCETTVPGLFAAGAVSGPWGAVPYTITGGGLTNAAVQGYRAGESASRYAMAQSNVDKTDVAYINRLKNKTYAPLQHKGMASDEMRINLIKAWVNLDIRDEARLNKAQEELQEIENEVSNLTANDFHELEKCHKTRSLIACSRAIASAALLRQETRLTHIRLDYPLRDDKDWLKWTVTRRDGDEFHTDTIDVPIERWKYKPEPLLVDPTRKIEKKASL